MKQHIGIIPGDEGFCLSHGREGVLDFRHLLVRTVGSRKRCSLGFEDLAHLLHMNQKMDGICCSAIPSEHIPVQQIPLRARLHPRPDLRPRQDEALGHQHLDRLTHSGAADAKGRAPFGLVGEERAGRKLTIEDARADILRDAAMQGTTRRFHRRRRRLCLFQSH